MMLTFEQFTAKYIAEAVHPLDCAAGGYTHYEGGLWMKHRIACWVQPQLIVELGVRAGYTGWAMLVGVPGAKYIGFDSYLAGHADVKNVPDVQIIFKAHAEKIMSAFDAEVRVANTQDTGFGFSVPRADLYHVDAAHNYDCARLDITNCLAAGDAHSIIAVHDFQAPLVQQAALDAAKRASSPVSVFEIPEPRNGDGLLFRGNAPEWLAEVDAQRLL